jgi:hypothetical protein
VTGVFYFLCGIMGCVGAILIGALAFFAGFFWESGRWTARREDRRFLRWRAHRREMAAIHEGIEELLRGSATRAS